MNGSEFAKKCMHEAGVAIVPELLLEKHQLITSDLVLQPLETISLRHWIKLKKF